MIWLPTLRQLIRMHEKVIVRSGGAAGMRDAGLIESALMRANASFGDYEAYPTVTEKAAAVCCGLIGNHGFVDGNKRIGVMAMLLILKKNGIALRYSQSELILLGLEAAQGNVAVAEVSAWINSHIA